MKRILLALAAVLVIGACSDSAPTAESEKIFNAETFTLDNGLQVVVISNHRAPIVTHMVWYKTGAADEPKGKSGIAHVLEHMMFKGTKDVPPGEFSKIIARNGGQDNAFTSSDYTAYFQNIARDRLELVMKMEADRMANLVLDPEHFLTERDVVVEERNSRVGNEPAAMLREKADAALWGEHPYRNPVIGWEEELKALTLEDARDYYDHRYAPNNAILVMGGDITAAELKPLAEKYYGVLPAREVTPRKRNRDIVTTGSDRADMVHPRSGPPAWARSYQAPSYMMGDPAQVHALEVLAEHLGGGATSTLYRALVVDKQLAASASAGYNAEAVDWGTFTFEASPRPGVTLAQLEEIMMAEVEAFLARGITEEETARAKKRLKAGVAYARDSLYMSTRIVGSHMAIGQPLADLEAWPSHIDAVTSEEVMKAARSVLEGNRFVTYTLAPNEES